MVCGHVAAAEEKTDGPEVLYVLEVAGVGGVEERLTGDRDSVGLDVGLVKKGS